MHTTPVNNLSGSQFFTSLIITAVIIIIITAPFLCHHYSSSQLVPPSPLLIVYKRCLISPTGLIFNSMVALRISPYVFLSISTMPNTSGCPFLLSVVQFMFTNHFLSLISFDCSF
ncbi:hypothetical protein TSMEX_007503 [Taenia solium]|eukprot:TsM_000168000 transcript=TsM_000168000 gene=TsM_000168000